MIDLYILKFNPIYKNKIWGGTRLKNILEKGIVGDKCGESWEISGVNNDISVVTAGELKGKNLKQLLTYYKSDLVGRKNYQQFGIEFPLLIKFIDANDVLSLQVHPDDKMAKELHNSFGKTEMWYVLESKKKANLIAGLKHKISEIEFKEKIKLGELSQVLNYEKVKQGDSFFLPAGQIHAIGAGVLLAEIQQSSDITYRVYDWDRKDENGTGRELHIENSIKAINFDNIYSSYITYNRIKNKRNSIKQSEFFTVNYLNLNKIFQIDYSTLDSFVIYMCVDGVCELTHNNQDFINLSKGETVLIPAKYKKLKIIVNETVEILEIFID